MELTVDQLSFSYSTEKLLKNICMHAASNKFTGIIGPNGCGKSTLLKCIYRVLKPSNGVVLLNDQTLQEMSIRESARHIAVMAQHNYYSFEFTVEDIVLMGRAPHKKMLENDTEQDYHLVRDALKTVGLSDFAKRNFSTLSGGEQQRVVLARALVQETECLILDEPTNHLDITHQLEMMRLIKDAHHTVLAAMHDFNIAAAFCDYLYVMKDGCVVMQGTAAEVFTPEILYRIYHVPAEIVHDSRGQMHILFLENTADTKNLK